MNELEKVREEALLNDVELLACRNYDSVTPDIERLEKAVAQVQLDKVLNHKLGSHTLKELIQMIDEGKLVKLADDQSLPEWCSVSFNSPTRCVQKMLEAGLKKVEPL